MVMPFLLSLHSPTPLATLVHTILYLLQAWFNLQIIQAVSDRSQPEMQKSTRQRKHVQRDQFCDVWITHRISGMGEDLMLVFHV